MQAYTVVYRTGGTENCEWKRTSNFSSRDEADRVRAETERMGYRALVFTAHNIDAIGMPQGWDYSDDCSFHKQNF